MVMAIKKQLNPGAAPYVYDSINNTTRVQRFSSNLFNDYYRHTKQQATLRLSPAQSIMVIYTAPAFYYNYTFTTTPTQEEHELPLQPDVERKNSVGPWKRTDKRRRCFWVPKSSSPSTADDGAHLFNAKFGLNYTTVMIKNVPNQLTRNSFMAILDDTCLQLNCNSIMSKNKQQATPCCAYDFVYLPIDFRTGCNRGYAFVNFTSPEAAARVCSTMHRRPWKSVRHSKKLCDVSIARIQGKTELIKHFKNVCYQCTNADYLPILLHPPRHGSSNTSSTISTIGILVR